MKEIFPIPPCFPKPNIPPPKTTRRLIEEAEVSILERMGMIDTVQSVLKHDTFEKKGEVN